jgi:hypothetical protein
MPAEVRVAAMRQRIDPSDDKLIINACSNGSGWEKDLSPFIIGPCQLYEVTPRDFGFFTSRNMENAWQYSKLYAVHADKDGNPTEAHWQWAIEGWNNPRAVRYPMGRGAKPLCSLWDGKKYGYVDARRVIYGPLYRDAVSKTEGFKKLKELYESFKGTIYIRDFDGYDEVEKGVTLDQVILNPKKKMGHAFVLKMLLTNSAALQLFR